MHPHTYTTESRDLIDRLRRVLASVQPDCQCRATLDSALDRFSDLELRRRVRSALARVRRQRDWIAAQLSFLAELDELSEKETDDSAFEELAALFDEIGASAASAAEEMREIRCLLTSVRAAGPHQQQ